MSQKGRHISKSYYFRTNMMKNLLITISLFSCLSALGQEQLHSDSVKVRILNKGKHYIKEHIITVNNVKYAFEDIWKNKYSDYQKLPFIWPNNLTRTQVIEKKMIKYDQWHEAISWPFDHIGEQNHLGSSVLLCDQIRPVA